MSNTRGHRFKVGGESFKICRARFFLVLDTWKLLPGVVVEAVMMVAFKIIFVKHMNM